jgi:hypothetical protein
MDAPSNETIVVPNDMRPYLAARVATPFQPAPGAGSNIGGTLDLSPEAAREAVRSATPFEASAPSSLPFSRRAPAPDPIGGTFDMSPELARQAMAQPVTPFEAYSVASSAPPAPPPSWVTRPAPVAHVIPEMAAPAPPPALLFAAPPPAIEARAALAQAAEDGEELGVLGSEFLAALAAAEA